MSLDRPCRPTVARIRASNTLCTRMYSNLLLDQRRSSRSARVSRRALLPCRPTCARVTRKASTTVIVATDNVAALHGKIHSRHRVTLLHPRRASGSHAEGNGWVPGGECTYMAAAGGARSQCIVAPHETPCAMWSRSGGRQFSPERRTTVPHVGTRRERLEALQCRLRQFVAKLHSRGGHRTGSEKTLRCPSPVDVPLLEDEPF